MSSENLHVILIELLHLVSKVSVRRLLYYNLLPRAASRYDTITAEIRKKQHIHTGSAFLEYKRCRLPRNGHVWYHPPTATVCPCECMSARSRLELPSSSSEEERRVTDEQDTTGNLGERFRLLARQVLRRRRYFSPRECVKFVAKRKTAPPEE